MIDDLIQRLRNSPPREICEHGSQRVKCVHCESIAQDAEIVAQDAEIVELVRALRMCTDRAERAEAERDACKLLAECHAQESRTANATIGEIYQLCTGSTGEPGNWHGAGPVRALVAERDALKARIEGAPVVHVYGDVIHAGIDQNDIPGALAGKRVALVVGEDAL